MSRILIVGDLSDEKWLGNLIYRVKYADPTIIIDCFWSELSKDDLNDSVQNNCNIVYRAYRHSPSILYNIPKIRFFIKERDITLSFQEFINQQYKKGVYYDIINYHFLSNSTLCCWNEVLNITRKTLLMPWGSDVLRRSKKYILKMRKYVKHYDYVCTSDNPRFRKQLTDKLLISENQFVELDFGSESIDRLMDNMHISQPMAKDALGLKDNFVITVGYNAHEEQHHIEVIDAITSIKEELPDKTLLVFPMTYGGKQQIKLVEQKVRQSGLKYKIYDKYLPYQDIVNLRKCSDIFIHAQTTDSNSASLAEYLFCRTIVINAAWLRYENFEQFGMPYDTFRDFSELPSILKKAIKGGSLVNDNLVNYIEQYSWACKTPKWVAMLTGKYNNQQL